jgi:hypothetical protein
MRSSQFKCGKCTRTFKTQGALNGHQRRHTFFTFLGKQMPKDFRDKEYEERQARIVLAAIKHYGQNNDESHCDVCAVVYEVIDKPLMRDLAAYFESEKR